MRWILVLAVACSRPADRLDACRLAERVAAQLARCDKADQTAVAELARSAVKADAHACAQQLSVTHRAAFAAGCRHALTREELGTLDEILNSTRR